MNRIYYLIKFENDHFPAQISKAFPTMVVNWAWLSLLQFVAPPLFFEISLTLAGWWLRVRDSHSPFQFIYLFFIYLFFTNSWLNIQNNKNQLMIYNAWMSWIRHNNLSQLSTITKFNVNARKLKIKPIKIK